MSNNSVKEFAEIITAPWVEKCRQLFEETQNPLYIWQAITAASPFHPWPEWIQMYLRKTAKELLKLPRQKRLGNKIAQALGFPGMGKSAHEQWRSDLRKKSVIRQIFERHKKEPDRPLNQIFCDVADELGISNITVENIFYRHTTKNK